MSRRVLTAMGIAAVLMACLPTTATPTVSPTPVRPTATVAQITPTFTPAACVPDAAYVADVTIPDGTPVEPGGSFTKTWRVRVEADCGGPFAAELIFDGGAEMGGPPAVPVSMPSEGGEVDVSVPLTAPMEPGTYRAYWRLRTQEGLIFGPRLFVEIVVPSPTETPTAPPPSQPVLAVLDARKDVWLFMADGEPYPSPISDPHLLPAWPEEGPTQAMGDTLYYVAEGSIWSVSLDGAVREVYRLSESVIAVDSFLISPDGWRLALATQEWVEGGIAPALSVYRLESEAAVHVEPPDPDTDHAFAAVAWTPEGDLIYAHTPWGIGGYILFGGYLSLHRWDGTTSHILFDPAAGYSFCIYALSLDQTLVAHSCNPPSPPNQQMKIYNLESLTETVLPAMADQGQMGAAHFSASNRWLAYSIARGEPDREAGSVVVVPSDVSAAPEVIYHVEGGHVVVRSWVGEDWLLVERYMGGEAHRWDHRDLLLIARDGSEVRLLASDARFLGVLSPEE